MRILSLLPILLILTVFGQGKPNQVSTITTGNFVFIEPTIEGLLHLEELTIEEWKKLVEEMEFEGQETQGVPLIYMKGSLGANIKTQSLGKDQKSVIIQWTNLTDDLLLMDKIEEELKSYYVRTEGDQKVYSYQSNGYSWTFTLKRNKELGMEEIYIRKL